MSPYTTVAFVCIGLAIAALPHPGFRPLVRVLATLTMLIGAVSFLGYFWNASELVTDRWLPPVAVNTAFCFMVLGVGTLLANRRQGTERRHRSLDTFWHRSQGAWRLHRPRLDPDRCGKVHLPFRSRLRGGNSSSCSHPAGAPPTRPCLCLDHQCRIVAARLPAQRRRASEGGFLALCGPSRASTSRVWLAPFRTILVRTSD